MVVIPAGDFTMGSPANEPGRYDPEGPQRNVSIRQFAAGKFDVTRAGMGSICICPNRPIIQVVLGVGSKIKIGKIGKSNPKVLAQSGLSARRPSPRSLHQPGMMRRIMCAGSANGPAVVIAC